MKKALKIFTALIILAALTVTGFGLLYKQFPLKYQSIVDECAQKYGFDKYYIYALIKAESNFEPDAVSHKDAFGLMQLTADTAGWCAQEMGDAALSQNILDPTANISMGCWYLAYLEEEFGNPDTALAAYNAGLGNVNKWLSEAEHSSDSVTLDSIPFPETEKYVKKVRLFEKVYMFLYDKK